MRLGWVGARVFSSPVTDTHCIISAGCQSLSPSPSRIPQSNVIYFVCQLLSDEDTFSLPSADICTCATQGVFQGRITNKICAAFDILFIFIFFCAKRTRLSPPAASLLFLITHFTIELSPYRAGHTLGNSRLYCAPDLQCAPT